MNLRIANGLLCSVALLIGAVATGGAPADPGTREKESAKVYKRLQWNSLGDFKALLPRHRPVAIGEAETPRKRQPITGRDEER